MALPRLPALSPLESLPSELHLRIASYLPLSSLISLLSSSRSLLVLARRLAWSDWLSRNPRLTLLVDDAEADEAQGPDGWAQLRRIRRQVEIDKNWAAKSIWASQALLPQPGHPEGGTGGPSLASAKLIPIILPLPRHGAILVLYASAALLFPATSPHPLTPLNLSSHLELCATHFDLRPNAAIQEAQERARRNSRRTSARSAMEEVGGWWDISAAVALPGASSSRGNAAKGERGRVEIVIGRVNGHVEVLRLGWDKEGRDGDVKQRRWESRWGAAEMLWSSAVEEEKQQRAAGTKAGSASDDKQAAPSANLDDGQGAPPGRIKSARSPGGATIQALAVDGLGHVACADKRGVVTLYHVDASRGPVPHANGCAERTTSVDTPLAKVQLLRRWTVEGRPWSAWFGVDSLGLMNSEGRSRWTGDWLALGLQGGEGVLLYPLEHLLSSSTSSTSSSEAPPSIALSSRSSPSPAVYALCSSVPSHRNAPIEAHLLFVGSYDGVVSVWDTREALTRLKTRPGKRREDDEIDLGRMGIGQRTPSRSGEATPLVDSSHPHIALDSQPLKPLATLRDRFDPSAVYSLALGVGRGGAHVVAGTARHGIVKIWDLGEALRDAREDGKGSGGDDILPAAAEAELVSARSSRPSPFEPPAAPTSNREHGTTATTMTARRRGGKDRGLSLFAAHPSSSPTYGVLAQHDRLWGVTDRKLWCVDARTMSSCPPPPASGGGQVRRGGSVKRREEDHLGALDGSIAYYLHEDMLLRNTLPPIASGGEAEVGL